MIEISELKVGLRVKMGKSKGIIHQVFDDGFRVKWSYVGEPILIYHINKLQSLDKDMEDESLIKEIEDIANDISKVADRIRDSLHRLGGM